jgi:uncharacterized protein (DUF2384 family)
MSNESDHHFTRIRNLEEWPRWNNIMLNSEEKAFKVVISSTSTEEKWHNVLRPIRFKESYRIEKCWLIAKNARDIWASVAYRISLMARVNFNLNFY